MGDGEFSQKLLAALPADPFEQLEVAQRLTSRAVAAGVSKLEMETGNLRQQLGEKDATIFSMQHQMVDLERTLQDTSFRLSQALESQGRVINEKHMLVSTVQKLKHEISKLEMFKKNLLQSLQEDDDSVTQHMEDVETTSHPTFMDSIPLKKVDERVSSIIPRSSHQEDLFNSRLTTTISDPATLVLHNDRGDSIARGYPMTPSVGKGSESTFRRSEAGTQAKASLSPARKSAHLSMSAIPGQVPKVDGKEFFRQARNRLSYQKFSAFLSNIKELNSHRQSREKPRGQKTTINITLQNSLEFLLASMRLQKNCFNWLSCHCTPNLEVSVLSLVYFQDWHHFHTSDGPWNEALDLLVHEALTKAEQIFGPQNQDLHAAFDALITHNAA